MDGESGGNRGWIVVYFLLKTNLVPHMESSKWKVSIWQRPSLTTESVQVPGKALLMKDIVGQCSTKVR